MAVAKLAGVAAALSVPVSRVPVRFRQYHCGTIDAGIRRSYGGDCVDPAERGVGIDRGGQRSDTSARRRDQWLLGCRQALGLVGVVLAGVALGVAFFLASGGGGSSWPATISRTSAGWRVIGPAYSDQSVEDLYGMRML